MRGMFAMPKGAAETGHRTCCDLGCADVGHVITGACILHVGAEIFRRWGQLALLKTGEHRCALDS